MPQHLSAADDHSLSNDSAESLRPEDETMTSPHTRGPGGPGDGNDEPKVGRDVPKAE